jgi:uncharacterized damage-inducible protein DinB
MLRSGRELLLMKKLEDYRKGAIGALMDEYERAAIELKSIVENINEDDYTRIVDTQTKDEDCRSIQTMMNHVVHAGYGYANGIRRKFSIPHAPSGQERRQIPPSEIGDEIDKVLAYTIETLDGMWEMSYAEMDETVITRKENFSESIEQLLEHAIVHILRHRRQVDKFLLKLGAAEN